jgi:hypothetical protein
MERVVPAVATPVEVPVLPAVPAPLVPVELPAVPATPVVGVPVVPVAAAVLPVEVPVVPSTPVVPVPVAPVAVPVAVAAEPLDESTEGEPEEPARNEAAIVDRATVRTLCIEFYDFTCAGRYAQDKTSPVVHRFIDSRNRIIQFPRKVGATPPLKP